MEIWELKRNSRFHGLITFREASEIWKIDNSTLRKAVYDGRLREGRDVWRFGREWVITVRAMIKFTDKPQKWDEWFRSKQEAGVVDQG